MLFRNPGRLNPNYYVQNRVGIAHSLSLLVHELGDIEGRY